MSSYYGEIETTRAKVLIKKDNTLAFDYFPDNKPFDRYRLNKRILRWLKTYSNEYIHKSIYDIKGEWVDSQDYVGESFIFYDPDVATLFKLTFGG